MIIYGLVAKKGFLIGEFSKKEGDFEVIALKLLQKAKITAQKQTYSQSGYQFTFFTENDYQILCMCEDQTDKQTIFQFLDSLNLEFKNLQQDQTGKSLSQLTSNTIKQLIEQFEKLKEKDILQQTEQELNQVTQIARQNIEKGIKLDVLIDKTNNLKQTAEQMSLKSKKMKNQLLQQQFRTKIMIGLLFFLAIIVILYNR